MQRITNFWKSGTAGKVILLIGSLFICCCACIATFNVMDGLGAFPTRTPTLIPTATFTSTATTIPTSTLLPTLTTVPTETQTPIPTETVIPTATIYIPPAQPTSAHPPGSSGQCVDGTYTYSQNRQGACSHHGGISIWWGP